jgi:hypothetical protein
VAIKSVRETFQNRTLAMDAKYQVDVSRQYIVITDNIQETIVSATSATDPVTGVAIPAFGDEHPEFSQATMVSASGKQDANNPFMWVIDCKYSSNPDSAATGGVGGSTTSSPEVAQQQKGVEQVNRIENPLNRPADIQLSTGYMNFVLAEDFSATPQKIVNSANELFSNPTMFRFPYLVVNASRNLNPLNISNLNYYCDRVNNASITLFGGNTGISQKVIQTGDLLIESLSAQRVLENGYSYWRASMILHVIIPNSWGILPEVESPGFDARLRDVGFNELINNSTTGNVDKLVRITGLDKQPVRVPADLDGTGKKLGVSGDPVYLKFKTHPRADLSWVNTFLSAGPF